VRITKITAVATAVKARGDFPADGFGALPEIRLEAELEPDDNPEACAEELQERAHIMLTNHCKRMMAAARAAERMKKKGTLAETFSPGGPGKPMRMGNIHLTMEDAKASMLRQILDSQGSQVQKAFEKLSKEERTTEFRRAMGVVEDVTP